jgi:hypothetical protein
MKPLITKAQGRACRKAAEYIVEGKWKGEVFLELPRFEDAEEAIYSIGWDAANGERDLFTKHHGRYDQSEVLTALLWCAEIAEEA